LFTQETSWECDLPFDKSATDRSETNVRETASQVLQRFTIGHPDEEITFGQMLDALGERGFGLMLMLFAVPNLLPFPGVPGVSFVTGMAILFISVQLILAKDEPAFPDWISRKSFSRAQLSKFIMKTNPLLHWLEKPIRPRLAPVVAGFAERLIGVAGVIHALTLALPIPMGNLPQAVALILLALALIELDGLMAILGYIASIAAVIWLALVVLGLGKIAFAVIG
jgi:hypothetical protein